MTILLLQTFFPELYSTTQSKYNLVRSNDHEFNLELNVAGFDDKDIDIELIKNRLTISSVGLDDTKDYLCKGIHSGSFKHTFSLNDHVVVKGAKVKNGILSVTLGLEVPEKERPQKIPITH